MREVVEEVLVECVDVRNYFRRPHAHHISPTRPFSSDMVGKKRDELAGSSSAQTPESIAAQVSLFAFSPSSLFLSFFPFYFSF